MVYLLLVRAIVVLRGLPRSPEFTHDLP